MSAIDDVREAKNNLVKLIEASPTLFGKSIGAGISRCEEGKEQYLLHITTEDGDSLAEIRQMLDDLSPDVEFEILLSGKVVAQHKPTP